MAEILDVINRFTYQVEDAELQRAAQAINQQISSLVTMGQRVQNLQTTFDRTATSEIEKRTRIAALIQRQKSLIDQTTQSIGQNVQQNAKLQQAITKEIGLINTLDARLRVLREDRAKAFDEKDIAKFNREIETTQKRINDLTGTGGGKKQGVLSTILQGVGIGTGIGLVTQGIGVLKTLITDSIRLAAESEGVSRAFNRLNDPNLLSNLRTSVKGTVSDLELMKQAVQFNNFGLPVEKLGIALSFARQRAQDTGQSIDYLVNSIVTGIGRQSPLILDNLGINAKRVADRFKETGNFAEAAFGIIQEESAKAGDALDTFADKQARMNASIENLKTRLGGIFNTLLGTYANGVETAITLISFLNERFVSIQKESEDESLKSLQQYQQEYKTATTTGRKDIEAGARISYENILRQQRTFQALGLTSTAQALEQQAQKYRDFFSLIRQKDVTFNNFTQSDLLGLTRDELEALKTEGDNALNPLAAGDKAGIKAVNDRISQINAALDRFSIKVTKVKKDVKDKPIKIRHLIEQTPEQWAQEVDKIAASLAKIRQPFSDINPTNSGVVSNAPNGTQNSDEIISQKNDIERAEIVRKENEEKEEAARQLRIQRQKDAFKTIADAAIQSYNTILQAQINAADAEIAIRQSRVNAAIELAKNGNTEILELEQKRLEESIKEREKYAQRQAAINAALTISQSVLAIATAAGESGAAALVIVPAVIAAIAAGFAAVTALSTESSTGFKDGVVDLQGEGNGRSDSIAARLSKGESVITAEATQKNKAVLMAMNNGAVFTMPNTYSANQTYNNTTDMSGVITELRDLKTVVADNQMKQDIFFNEYGVGMLTERARRTAQKIWT